MTFKYNLIKNQSKSDLLKIIALLSVITWIANFWYFRDLGLYLDDYQWTGKIIGYSTTQLINIINWLFSSFFQGRPIGYSILFISSFVNGKLFDLQSLYLFSYILVLINNLLYYIFLRQLWIQPIFCISGVLAYTLFPADNSRTWLASIEILPAFTFLLLAFLSYFSEKKILSYVFIIISLLCYETAFPLFLLAPLFKNQWNKQLNKKIIIHFLVCSLIFAIYILIRKIFGDSRISNLDLISTLKLSIHQMLFGPLISLYMFVHQIFSLKLTTTILFLMVIAFICLFWIFTGLKSDKIKIIDNAVILKKLALLGIALLLLAYPLTLTVDASVVSGDGSRVHNASAMGASILFGLICYLVVTFFKNYRLHQLTLIVVAGYFSLLVSFGLTVQNDNRLSWQYQQAFWSDIVKLAPDISDGIVILVDSPSLNQVWGSQLHPFSEYVQVLPDLYKFPEKWKTLPSLYRLDSHWEKKVTTKGKIKLAKEDGLIYHGSLWYIAGPERILETNDIILIQEKNGKLIRQTEPLIINNIKYQFKPLTASTVQTFPKNYLYKDLIPKTPPEVNYLKPF